MTYLTQWEPSSEMGSLRQAVDILFGNVRPWHVFNVDVDGASAYFPVDVYETDDEVVVTASLPGIKPEDIDISVTGQLLTITGEAKEEVDEKAQGYYRRERRAGTFHRHLTLPTEVESASADAAFDHGVLRLTLPKIEAMKPKTIKVHATPAIEAKASLASATA